MIYVEHSVRRFGTAILASERVALENLEPDFLGKPPCAALGGLTGVGKPGSLSPCAVALDGLARALGVWYS